MDWASRAAIAVGGLAHFGAARYGQRCTCVVDVREGFSADRELLKLLEGQLQRCGPANLTVPAPCPVPECFGHPGSVALLVAILAFWAGVATACLGAWAWTRRSSRPVAQEARAPVADVQDGRQLWPG